MDIATLLNLIPGAAPYIAGAVAIASALGTLLPPPKLPASGWYPLLYGLVNFIALNLGQARNANSPGVPR